jgi:hypothetical protein
LGLPVSANIVGEYLEGICLKVCGPDNLEFSQTIENARFVRHKQSVSRTMSPQQMFSQNSAAFSTRCRFEVISITTDFEADPFKM